MAHRLKTVIIQKPRIPFTMPAKSKRNYKTTKTSCDQEKKQGEIK